MELVSRASGIVSIKDVDEMVEITPTAAGKQQLLLKLLMAPIQRA